MKQNDKILVVFTGGTICTSVKDGVISVDPEAPSVLIDFFQSSDSEFVGKVELHKGKYFGILSENMTVERWNDIIEYFQEISASLNEYKGIIIAHGTDTLAFSSALFSLLFKGISIPVFFVSSNRSVLGLKTGKPSEKANGNANFRAAVECIMNEISPDVYVTYENPEDKKMYLHYAENLLQCKNYDENFYSKAPIDITDSKTVKTVSKKEPVPFEKLPIMKLKGRKLRNCVLKITPYVGLDYDVFNLSKCRAVLHGTYHSGTACVEKSAAEYERDRFVSSSSILNFIDRCAKENVDFYYAPSEVEGGASVYDTVPLICNRRLGEKGVNISYGMTDELMYAKLLIKYAE